MISLRDLPSIDFVSDNDFFLQPCQLDNGRSKGLRKHECVTELDVVSYFSKINAKSLVAVFVVNLQ